MQISLKYCWATKTIFNIQHPTHGVREQFVNQNIPNLLTKLRSQPICTPEEESLEQANAALLYCTVIFFIITVACIIFLRITSLKIKNATCCICRVLTNVILFFHIKNSKKIVYQLKRMLGTSFHLVIILQEYVYGIWCRNIMIFIKNIYIFPFSRNVKTNCIVVWLST